VQCASDSGRAIGCDSDSDSDSAIGSDSDMDMCSYSDMCSGMYIELW